MDLQEYFRCAHKGAQRKRAPAAQGQGNGLFPGAAARAAIAARLHGHSELVGTLEGAEKDRHDQRQHGLCALVQVAAFKARAARDLRLAEETGCAYHVCHISTKESVELIRQAKAHGVNVTCETAPHYLVLCDEDMQEDGRFKMNPPLRSREDKKALIEGINDGTIDMIATDHAPHSAEEKGRGLEKSLMGIVGLETAFPVLYTELVTKNIITLDRLVELMSFKPKERFGIDTNNDFAVFDISEAYKIDPEDFLSMGRATPFAGREVFGRCLLTVHNGKVVYKAEDRA